MKFFVIQSNAEMFNKLWRKLCDKLYLRTKISSARDDRHMMIMRDKKKKKNQKENVPRGQIVYSESQLDRYHH